MIQISLTDFVDYASKSGGPKLTKVRQLKKRPPYHPMRDFYKKLRDRIVVMHEKGESPEVLDEVLEDHLNDLQLRNFPKVIQTYKRFLSRKKIQWFSPPTSDWRYRNLEVSVNPELGLVIKGVPYVIKLHFKNEPIASEKVAASIHLMEEELKQQCDSKTQFAILDMQNAKLLLKGKRSIDFSLLLSTEASSFITMWNKLN